jgi:hypothetical protein
MMYSVMMFKPGVYIQEKKLKCCASALELCGI